MFRNFSFLSKKPSWQISRSSAAIGLIPCVLHSLKAQESYRSKNSPPAAATFFSSFCSSAIAVWARAACSCALVRAYAAFRRIPARARPSVPSLRLGFVLRGRSRTMSHEMLRTQTLFATAVQLTIPTPSHTSVLSVSTLRLERLSSTERPSSSRLCVCAQRRAVFSFLPYITPYSTTDVSFPPSLCCSGIRLGRSDFVPSPAATTVARMALLLCVSRGLRVLRVLCILSLRCVHLCTCLLLRALRMHLAAPTCTRLPQTDRFTTSATGNRSITSSGGLRRLIGTPAKTSTSCLSATSATWTASGRLSLRRQRRLPTSAAFRFSRRLPRTRRTSRRVRRLSGARYVPPPNIYAALARQRTLYRHHDNDIMRS